MAFAMQVAAKQKALADCTQISDDAQSALSDASAPPMKLVHIGPAGDAGFEIGQETVMFRHEEKFHRMPGLAVKIAADLAVDDALARVEQINNAVFTRVGQELKVALAAVDIEGLTADNAAARVKALAARSKVPLVIMGTDANAMAAAVAGIADSKPLIYRATESNADAFIRVAADNKCPLAASAGSLEKLADIAKAAKDKGVEDMVLAFDVGNTVQTIRDITVARRAAREAGVPFLGRNIFIDHTDEIEDIKKRLAELYEDKELLAKTSLVLLTIFASFLNDDDYFIKGIDRAGIAVVEDEIE